MVLRVFYALALSAKNVISHFGQARLRTQTKRVEPKTLPCITLLPNNKYRRRHTVTDIYYLCSVINKCLYISNEVCVMFYEPIVMQVCAQIVYEKKCRRFCEVYKNDVNSMPVVKNGRICVRVEQSGKIPYCS